MADDPTFVDDIEGYPGRLSCRPGDVVDLHVSTRAERFDVVVERWGAERVEMWRASGVTGSYVPVPSDADACGCAWPVAVQIPVGTEWPSGFYLTTLIATDGPQGPGRDIAHAGFIVRSARPSSNALLVLATNSWNAYNNWGGKSLYTGGHCVSFRRPFGRGMLCRPEVERDDRKARPARWGEEPDVNGDVFETYRTRLGYPPSIGSTGWFAFERRFVEWAERNGFTLDYAISSDLDEIEDVLGGYRLVLSVGHDEYWSAPQRDRLEAAIAGGTNFASFSGNTMFWQVRHEDADGDGVPDAMVCHKYTAHRTDPVVAAGRTELMTGMWCDPLVGRPEWSVLGGGSAFGLYYRYGAAVARGAGGFTVYRDDHWMLEGTGLRYGDVLGAQHGAVGYETLGCRIQLDDHQLPVAAAWPGMPDDVEIVAFVPASNLAVGEYPASISASADQGDLEFIASRVHGGTDADALARARFGNACVLTCRPFGVAGGDVVTVGTVDWVFGLAGDRAVEQVTRNVIDRLTRSDVEVAPCSASR